MDKGLRKCRLLLCAVAGEVKGAAVWWVEGAAGIGSARGWCGSEGGAGRRVVRVGGWCGSEGGAGRRVVRVGGWCGSEGGAGRRVVRVGGWCGSEGGAGRRVVRVGGWCGSEGGAGRCGLEWWELEVGWGGREMRVGTGGVLGLAWGWGLREGQGVWGLGCWADGLSGAGVADPGGWGAGNPGCASRSM
nr:hypothetical protein KPHV_84960 [Kitasatospora purpeofusca]